MATTSKAWIVLSFGVALLLGGCTRRPGPDRPETPAPGGEAGATAGAEQAAGGSGGDGEGGACENEGAAEPFSRLVQGAHRGCTADEDCTTVKLNCSHLDCTAVHRDHAGAYSQPIDCEGYQGAVGNYDCDPQFDIEAPRCREGCCVSENILEEHTETVAGPAETQAETCPLPCRKLGESAPASANGLEAYVSLLHCGGTDARELLINARVWNVSGQTVRFFRMPTRYPMLVFEIHRAGGETLPNGPPPVPPAGPQDDWWLELSPDQDYLWDASVGQVVAIDLEPGDYELRFVYENADGTGGAWVGKLETGWVRWEEGAEGAESD